MKGLCWALCLFVSIWVKATETCTQPNASEDKNPYKIHLLDEIVAETEKLVFSIQTVDGATPVAQIQTPLFYRNGTDILKNRHGQQIPAAELPDHIGVYIEFGNGTGPVEITDNPTLFPPDVPNGNTYSGKTYFRLKHSTAGYGNGAVEVEARWKITCVAG